MCVGEVGLTVNAREVFGEQLGAFEYDCFGSANKTSFYEFQSEWGLNFAENLEDIRIVIYKRLK